MERRVAKELLHVRNWLLRAEAITSQGKERYLTDDLLQEAIANRNFIIHQDDAIDREQTWLTLSVDLPAWQAALKPLTVRAAKYLDLPPE